jgi:hypothetical protein
MKVLLGWQLGGGQGHIHLLASLAELLEYNGFEPIFALKSYNIKGISFKWKVVFAPSLPFSGRGESYTFADILETFGFGNVNLLRSHLEAWAVIIKEVKPSLIIADHAPGLVLAARGIVPVVVVGNGFTVPPPVEVFPPLRFPSLPESIQRQEQVSRTVRQLVKSDAPLGEILNGDASFIFSIPELDLYQHLRANHQYVSLHITPIPNNLHSSKGFVWAYLDDNYPSLALVVQTLQAQREFKPLKEVLAGKSLAVHHGGLTTGLTCLLAGIPQLILPRHLEEQLNAIAFSGLGVAKIIARPTWQSLLTAQAQAYELADNAKQQASNLVHWNQNFIKTVVQSCLELAANS